MRYLEILEQEEITGIICSQTVIMNVKQLQKNEKKNINVYAYVGIASTT
jgi:hypothetical protein